MAEHRRTLHVAPRLHPWLRPFLRRTSGSDFVPVIDGLRFYAIGAVVLYHVVYNLEATGQLQVASPWLAALSRAFGHGWFGVELFFVISGFILAVPFAGQHLHDRSPVRLSRYYLRRLTRLEPPYLLSLAVLFVARAWFAGESGLLPHLLASSLYSHTVIFGEHSRVSAVTWSLEVEVQFYLLAPLLGQWFRVRPMWLRRGSLLAVAACLAVWNRETGPHIDWLLPYLNYFLAGFLLADIHTVEWRAGREVPTGLLWDGVATLGWVAQAALLDGSENPSPWLPVAVFVTYYAILRSRAWYWLTTRPVLFLIGGMCYSIYLYHNFLIRGFLASTHVVGRWNAQLGGDVGMLLTVATVVPFVLAASSAVFVLVERPCMEPDWHLRLWRKLFGRAPASAEQARS